MELKQPLIVIQSQNNNQKLTITLDGKQTIKQGVKLLNDLVRSDMPIDLYIYKRISPVKYKKRRISIDEENCVKISGNRILDNKGNFIKINRYRRHKSIKINSMGTVIKLAGIKIELGQNYIFVTGRKIDFNCFFAP